MQTASPRWRLFFDVLWELIMPQPGLTTPDNDALPWQTTLLLALQHVLVVAATPLPPSF